MYEGHTYNIEISAYEKSSDIYMGKTIGEATVVLTGTAKAYVASPLNFESVTPDQSTIISSSDQNTFVVTFDGPVTLDKDYTYIPTGYGTHQDFESITPTEGIDSEEIVGKSYSKSWTLVVPESFLASIDGQPFKMSIVAYDKDGLRLGETETSYISLSYSTTIGIKDVNITPANGATIRILSKFYVDNSEGMNTSGLVNVKNAILYDKDKNEVAHIESAEQYIPASEEDNWSYNPTRVIIKLDKEINTVVEYTLHNPAQFFIYGTGQMSKYSKEENISYTIIDKEFNDFAPTSVEPTPNSMEKVKSLSTLTLTFDKQPVINPNITDAVTVYDRTSRNQVATGTLSASGNDVTVTLSEEIKTDGTYTVNIAEGAIGDEAYGSSSYTEGSCNAALSYGYIVSSEEVKPQVVTIEPNEGEVTSLKHFVLTWDNESADGNWNITDQILLVDIDGNVVTSAGNIDIYCGEEFNQMEFDLKEEVTEAGTYTLKIPAGRFLLGDMVDRESEAMEFEYTITDATGISSLFSDETSSFNVYNVNGVKVMSTTDKAELGKLTKGLYIINGKKVIIR